MVDTIILMLGKDFYHISEPDKFEPSARLVLESSSRAIVGIQSKQNPTKKELLAGIYKPRLTLTKRINNAEQNVEVMLKVELSLPKLLFGNNFDELMAKDLKVLADKLASVLATMGVIITAHQLLKAPVSVIHYSKNIPLTDGSTPYHYINKIKEANIKLSLDVNETHYRNDGHGFKWHANSYEVAFYDKIKDLEKARLSDKRTVEKDNALQLNLFDKFQHRHKLEFLRMEVRLNKRQKIKQLFKSLGITTNLTLKSLFKVNIAKKVLLHYIDELERKRSALMDYRPTSDKALLADLIFSNPALGAKQILQLYGFKKALEVANIRELRTMFPSYNQRSWYRLIADVNNTILPNAHKPFNVLRENLSKFKTCKYGILI